jgi:hypothetical protein
MTTQTQTHTPTPYEIIVDEESPLGMIWSPASETTIVISAPNGQGDLEVMKTLQFIVRACNAHDKLVEALQYALEFFEANNDGCGWADKFIAPRLETVRAALRLAKGKE